MDFNSVDLTKIYDLAGKLAEAYRSNLEKEQVIGSNDGIKTFTYTIQYENNMFEVAFILPKYWGAIEFGRRPDYKNENPWSDPVGDIVKWLKFKRLPVPASFRKNSIKPKKSTLSPEEKYAYAIVKKIRKKGYYGKDGQHYGKHILQHTLDENDELINEIADEIGAQITRLSIGKDIENFDK